MKLLIISDAWHPQVNGVVRTYEYLCDELKKLGHDVHVIGPADFPFSLPLPGYPEIRLAVTPYRRLQQLIETIKPESIHIATEGPLGWAARKYCLRHKKPFTTSYHTHFPDYVAQRFAYYVPFVYPLVHALGKAYVRAFHARADLMMIATPGLEAVLKGWTFKTPMHRLSRGVKLAKFFPGEKTRFQDLKGPIALYVGRIAIEKSIEDFLRMDWQGSKVVVGDGPQMKSLKRKYPDIIFTGKKVGAELAEYYRSADVFVFPSKTDTFGIVIIEALASGLPVAAYNVTGPKDIITQPFLGALHKNDLSKAALNALGLAGKEDRARYVREHYTWENTARQFEQAMIKTAWPKT